VNAAIIYWSKTGNTEKVALAIKDALEENGVQVTYVRAEEAGELDWFAYDLVCLGFPSYQWSPPKPVDELLKAKFAEYRKQDRIKTGAPRIPGKNALVFCTYSGPHTGIDEALPAVKYAGQYFAHLGFVVLDDWCIVGEFHGSEERSTMGPLGDIRGRPNEDDLSKVRQDVKELLERVHG
jgi:flavorubredoxin